MAGRIDLEFVDVGLGDAMLGDDIQVRGAALDFLVLRGARGLLVLSAGGGGCGHGASCVLVCVCFVEACTAANSFLYSPFLPQVISSGEEEATVERVKPQ